MKGATYTLTLEVQDTHPFNSKKYKVVLNVHQQENGAVGIEVSDLGPGVLSAHIDARVE